MRKNEEYLQSSDEGATTSSSSLFPTYAHVIHTDYASMVSHLWDHEFDSFYLLQFPTFLWDHKLGTILNIHMSFHHEEASLYMIGEA